MTEHLFEKNQKFDSLLEVEKRLHVIYERTKYTFSIGRSKSLQSACNRKGRKPHQYNVNLFYNEVTYICPLGGTQQKSKGEGLRKKQ